MTHEQRALLKSVQKVRGVLDRYPDGVTLSQITGDTQLSSGAARAALKHMGAECEDGLWFDVAVDEVEQSGNAGELEPVTAESVQQEIIADFLTVHAMPVAESAPVEPVTIEPQPELEKLTQAVFEGLPSEYRWAAVDANGEAHLYNRAPELSVANDVFGYFTNFAKGDDYLDLGDGYDASDWQNSLIERVDVPTIVGIDWAEQTQTLAEAQAEIKRLKVSHARYETLRKLNVVQFQALYTKSLQSPIPFDELVDMLGVQS